MMDAETATEAAPQETLLGNDPTPTAPEQPAAVEPGATGATGEWDFRSLLQPDGSWAPNWTESLPDHLKDKKEHFGKYPGVIQLLEANDNLSTLLGKKSRAVVPPDPGAPQEEKDKFFAAIGRPDSPEGYALKDEKGLYGEGELQEIAQAAFDAGLTGEQAQRLFEMESSKLEKLQKNAELRMVEEEEKMFNAAKQQLEQEYGAQLPTIIEEVKKVLAHAGATADDIQGNPALRNPDVIRWLARLGPKLGDDRTLQSGMPSNAGSTGGNAYDQAHDIMTNPANPYHERYRKGEAPVVSMVQGLIRRAHSDGSAPESF